MRLTINEIGAVTNIGNKFSQLTNYGEIRVGLSGYSKWGRGLELIVLFY